MPSREEGESAIGEAGIFRTGRGGVLCWEGGDREESKEAKIPREKTSAPNGGPKPEVGLGFRA